MSMKNPLYVVFMLETQTVSEGTLNSDYSYIALRIVSYLILCIGDVWFD